MASEPKINISITIDEGMGNIEVFERTASQYDTEERMRIAKIITDAIRKELTDTNGKQLLDYGCGTGSIGLGLAEVFESVILVDASGNMIAQVEKKIKETEIANASTLCCDLCSEVPEGLKADYIVVSQVLLHVKEFSFLTERLYDILNPEGHLIIVDFDKNMNIVSDLVHNGFVQSELEILLKGIGFSSVRSYTFYHGKNMFMGKDASLFLSDARK